MRLAQVPIEPIVKTRTVPIPVDRAFELFTADIGTWWPVHTHSIGQSDDVKVRFEGWVGGRVIETAATGEEHAWADVIAWDPPHRVLVAWHPSTDPDAASILDVRFEPSIDGTVVRLEHRGWEEFGESLGRELRSAYDPGWDETLAFFTAACD